MKQFLRKFLKYLAYTSAAVVILLAVAVGLFRLLLPKLPEYQEQIKDWANTAIGMEVEFSGMDARWRLSGPELSFYDARLVTKDGGATVLNAEEVSVGVGLLRLLLDLELVADRVAVREASIGVLQQADGSWHVQGISLDDLLEAPIRSTGAAGPLLVVGEDIEIELHLVHRAEPVAIGIDALEFRRDDAQLGFDASLDLPATFGTRLELEASRRLSDPDALNPWKFYIEGRAMNLAELSHLWPDSMPQFASGTTDFNLWLDVAPGGVLSATANLVAAGLTLQNADGSTPVAGAGNPPVTARGRVDFSKGVGDWLLAADEFVLTTAAGVWPESSLRVRVTTQSSGEVDTVHVSASYFDLDDLRYIAPLIPEDLRSTYGNLALSGVLRDVDVELVRAGSAADRFDVSAVMDRAGVAPYNGWPGVRGFSGTIRADQSGGRLELDSTDTQLDLTGSFTAPIEVEEAAGTVIWRRSGEGITVLSDSISIRTADLDSQSSLQVTLPSGDESPVLDLQSRWSFENVATVERYLPLKLIKPGLYRWLDNALVSGHVAQGTARFVGPLDRFPFGDGSGTFRLDAHVDNAVLRYSDDWPDITNINLDFVIENTRLYSLKNTATSLGNRSVDVRMEIPDLRAPILHIGASATGTLNSIQDFASHSPIATVFGGHLDKVAAEGNASFSLDLTYPVLDKQNYEFTTTIHSDNGTLRIAGLPAPITELNGNVTITRDTVASEALGGRFLGDPVTFDLMRAGDDTSYSAVATAQGTVGAAGLVEGLGVPLADLLDGHTAYATTINFPKVDQDEPVPLTIEIASDLQGMALNMPEPLGKPADTTRDVSLTISFPQEGRIESHGYLAENVRWDVGFARTSAGWDFDRGVLALGGALPGEPETRGLHIEGSTPVLNFDDWLDLADAGGNGPGFGDRIRSIDLTVDDLHVIGQHLARHRVKVNRSAFDWAVQLDGEDAVGSITIPYDFASGRTLVLEMQKLTLPGGEEGDSEVEQLGDPRKLPPLSVHADEFSLGERHFGRLDVEFLRTDAGLEASAIKTESPSFGITGSAGWIVDQSNSTGQRSYITARMVSNNVQQTMQQLDYLPGIESEQMVVEFDVSWSGGPKQNFLETLDGTVGVRLGSGQLNEVEPGAGRVFGLMSIVALPRRLSLDFSDVFERGFGFDEITGTFRLDDGQAYTCDLSLKGPAADVGIVGRTGLLAKNYEQTAVVSANVGNTLPVVGAVVAGPQVAAALLIFSQIFKKPLQEMGQIYYSIEGTWEDPVVDVVEAQKFARISEIAGCLETAE